MAEERRRQCQLERWLELGKFRKPEEVTPADREEAIRLSREIHRLSEHPNMAQTHAAEVEILGARLAQIIDPEPGRTPPDAPP